VTDGRCGVACADSGRTAGCADYFEVDVTLLRIIWLLTAVFTGVGFIAYIMAWIAMPKEYGPPSAGPGSA
jgi:phage shock protein PspC (stress-responsive transcriptional regulator)